MNKGTPIHTDTSQMPETTDHFNPNEVALEGDNLIEASAGTGKTHSIAIMLLRLIVEKDIPIGRILMVTFTKAAVAELELRVRSFVRQALKVSRGQDVEERTIREYITGQMTGGREDEVRERLIAAQLMLEETSVMTIHSFCQRILTEYSFETGQVFRPETLSPEAVQESVAESFREFWRQRISTLRKDLLEWLLSAGMGMDSIFSIVKGGLSGKTPDVVSPIPAGFLGQAWQDATLADISSRKAEFDRVLAEIESDLAANRDAYLDLVRGNANAKKAYEQLIVDEDWQGLVKAIAVSTTQYTPRIFPGPKPLADRMTALSDMERSAARVMINQIARTAYDRVKDAFEAEKKSGGLITFDDMINKVHDALSNGVAREHLARFLRENYEAVFIDEFQDTDKAQYDIFRELFLGSSILFFIGDPKQSIYGFRKADIFTYFTAREGVQRIHRMNVNRRSSAAYIEAMNGFFKPTPAFDTFHFAGQVQSIDYQPVQSPDPNTRGELLYDGQPVQDVLRISRHQNKKNLRYGVSVILEHVLLSGRYTIRTEAGGAAVPVGPEDIGILVRSNREGAAMKELLARMNIPAVTIDDARIFASQEAKELYHVMYAAYDISRSNINRALLTRLGGYDTGRLLSSDEDDILQRFRNYQELWKSDGVYVMLRSFLSDHGIEGLYRDRDLPNPERTVSNVLQLAETVHRVSEEKRYSPIELIQWLKKGIDGETREGDEYLQRIESDEKAVRIVTIHKSKGLEYKIVIAPDLDLTENKQIKTYSYRNPDDQEYYVIDRDLLPLDDERIQWAREQAEQENRRLLYVAVTRARYLCHITSSNVGYHSRSTLRTFRNALDKVDPKPGIHLDWTAPAGGDAGELPVPVLPVRQYAVAANFDLLEKHWRKASYTALSLKKEPVYRPAAVEAGMADDYDRFTFRELRRGSHTGNLLHNIFENMDFADDRFWQQVVEQSVRRLAFSRDDAYRDKVMAMLSQVTRARILPGSDFSLSMVDRGGRLAELEFDYSLSLFNTRDLLALSTPETPFFLETDKPLEGIMNGKIDLLFRHDGRFYILDWKSNHLGYSLADYGPEGVAAAMLENNYHLQYLIYTVAVRRYLATRMPTFDYEKDFGGVIYLFVRGVRAGRDKGVFFTIPDKALVDRMEGLMAGAMPATGPGR
jgi:exodeoxyribonuclease V beta subunit